MALLDRDNGDLSWVSAGHLPPAVRRADGTVELLDTAPLPPIGIVDVPGPATHTRLAAGACLVLYTDGLIERRTRPIDDGLDALGVALSAVPLGAGARPTRDHLLATLATDEAEDDVAIVVVDTSPAHA